MLSSQTLSNVGNINVTSYKKAFSLSNYNLFIQCFVIQIQIYYFIIIKLCFQQHHISNLWRFIWDCFICYYDRTKYGTRYSLLIHVFFDQNQRFKSVVFVYFLQINDRPWMLQKSFRWITTTKNYHRQWVVYIVFTTG